MLVVVDDVNDNSPVFEPVSYDVTVASDAPRGAFIARVAATDADSGRNARVTYRFAARTQVRHIYAPHVAY